MFIGLAKSDIIKQLTEQYVEFANWLYLPTLHLLLSFEKQQCMEVKLLK